MYIILFLVMSVEAHEMSWSLFAKKRVLYLLHPENVAVRHSLSIGQPLEVLQNDSVIIYWNTSMHYLRV